MRLIFIFCYFLFSFNCLCTHKPSKEFEDALKVFHEAILTPDQFPIINSTNTEYLVTGGIYQMDPFATPWAPNEFRWNSSIRPEPRVEYTSSLTKKEEIYKCNLRPLAKKKASLSEAGEEIKKARMKIWRYNYSSISSSPNVPSHDYSLLWVQRGFSPERWQVATGNPMLEVCFTIYPPDKLTLQDFEFLKEFMTEQHARELFDQ